MPADFSPAAFAQILPAPLWLPLAALAAFALDRLLGEPSRWHPLIGFGGLASRIEGALNRGGEGRRRMAGVLAWALVVLPFVALAGALKPAGVGGWLLDVLLLYLALGVALGNWLGTMLTGLYAEFFFFPVFEHRIAPRLLAQFQRQVQAHAPSPGYHDAAHRPHR